MQNERARLQRYRERFAQMLDVLARETLRTHSGEADDASSSELRAPYASLLDREECLWLSALSHDVDPIASHTLRNFSDEVARQMALCAAAAEHDELVSRQARRIFMVNGQSVPERAIPVHLARETDRGKRARLQECLEEAWREDRSLYERSRALLFEAGPMELSQEEEGRMAERFLESTNDLGRDCISWLLERRLSRDLSSSAWHDVFHVLHDQGWEEEIRFGTLRALVGNALRKIGVDPTSQGSLVLDVSDHPRRAAEPLLLPMCDRVVLLMRPRGGLWDAQTYLTLLGEGLMVSYPNPMLPFEARRFADPELPKTFGFLLGMLTCNPLFLKKVLKARRPEEMARLAWILFLVQSRLAAARILGEFDVREPGNRASDQERRRELERRALYVASPMTARVDETEPRGIFKGRCLAAMLANRLREELDEDWFRNPRAGPFLADFWEQGGLLTEADVLGKPFDEGVLRKEIEGHLQ